MQVWQVFYAYVGVQVSQEGKCWFYEELKLVLESLPLRRRKVLKTEYFQSMKGWKDEFLLHRSWRRKTVGMWYATSVQARVDDSYAKCFSFWYWSYDQFCALGTCVQRVVTNTHFWDWKVEVIMKWNCLAILALIQAVKGQQISGYGPVDVAELNPLTLNWNQVQF